MPEPVVPATRPWGPSARMSMREDPVGRLADDRPRCPATTGPAREDPTCFGFVESEYVEQPAGRGQGAGEVLGGDVLDRCEGTGDPVEPESVDEVGPDRIDSALGAHLEVELVALPDRHGAALLGQLAHGLVEAEEEDAARGTLLEQRDHTGRHPDPASAVQDDDATRQPGSLLLLERTARLELRQELADLQPLGLFVGGQPHGAGVVLAVARVREPLDPVPVGRGLVTGEDRQCRVRRAVHRGHLRHGPHRDRARALRRPGDADDADHREGHGHVGCGPQQRPFVSLSCRVLDGHLGGQVGGSDPQVQEVAVPPTPFPEPGARARGEKQHGCRVGEVAPAGASFGDERVECRFLYLDAALPVVGHVPGMALLGLSS